MIKMSKHIFTVIQNHFYWNWHKIRQKIVYVAIEKIKKLFYLVRVSDYQDLYKSFQSAFYAFDRNDLNNIILYMRHFREDFYNLMITTRTIFE